MFTILFGVVAGAGGFAGLFNILYASSLIHNNALIWYKFNEPSGTAVNDYMGNYPATYINSPTLGATGLFFEDKYDDAFAPYAGVRYAKTNSSFNNPQVFSITALFKTSSAYGQVFALSNAVNAGDRSCYVDNTGKLRFMIWDGGAVRTITSTTTVNDGNLHHVAIVHPGSSNTKMYIDGTQEGGNLSYNGFNQSQPWCIGHGYFGTLPGLTDFQFNGTIDEWTYFTKALSAQDVTMLHKASTEKFNHTNMQADNTLAKVGTITYETIRKVMPNIPTPVSWWRLNEASGIAYDDTGLHNLTNISTGGTYQIEGIPNSSDYGYTGAADNGFRKAVTSSFNYESGAVELWCKGGGATTEYIFQSADESDINVRLVIHTDNAGQIVLYTSKSSGNNYRVQTRLRPLEDDKWHHIVAQSTGAASEIYVDGIKENNPIITSNGTGAAGDWFADINPSLRDSITLGYGVVNGTPSSFYTGSIAQIAVYDAALTAAQILTNYAAGIGHHGLVDKSGYIGYWKLDENTGTNAADLGGTYNGTYTNTPILGVPSGNLSPCVDLDSASTEYISIADAAALDLDSGFITLGAWVRYQAASGSLTIISKDANPSHNGTYHLQTNGDSQIRFTFYDGSFNNFFDHTSSVDLKDSWHHVVLTHKWGDADSTKIYIDGREMTGGAWTGGDGTGTPTAGSDPLKIGARSNDNANPWDGRLNHVFVSDRYLSWYTIQALYQYTGIELYNTPKDDTLIFEQDFTSEASTSSNWIQTVFSSDWGIISGMDTSNTFYFNGPSSPKNISVASADGGVYNKTKIYGSNIRITMNIKFVTNSAHSFMGVGAMIPDPTGSVSHYGITFGYRYYNPGTIQRYYVINEMQTAGVVNELATTTDFGVTDNWTGNTFEFIMEIRNGIIHGIVDGVTQLSYDASSILQDVGYAALIKESSLAASDVAIYDFKVEYI